MTDRGSPDSLVERTRTLIEGRPSGGVLWWAIEEVLTPDESDPTVEWWPHEDHGPTISLGAGDDVIEFGLEDPTASDGWAAFAPDRRLLWLGWDREEAVGRFADADDVRVVPAISTRGVQLWLEELVAEWRPDLSVVPDPDWDHHVHPLAWVLDRADDEVLPGDLDTAWSDGTD